MSKLSEKSEKQRLLDLTNERSEFTMLEDGFYYYFPSGGGGFSSHNLRMLAEILDEKNKPHEDSLNDYFDGQRPVMRRLGQAETTGF